MLRSDHIDSTVRLKEIHPKVSLVISKKKEKEKLVGRISKSYLSKGKRHKIWIQIISM